LQVRHFLSASLLALAMAATMCASLEADRPVEGGPESSSAGDAAPDVSAGQDATLEGASFEDASLEGASHDGGSPMHDSGALANPDAAADSTDADAVADAPSPTEGDAPDADGEAGAVGPTILWIGQSTTEAGAGLYPTVAVGTADAGSWVIQVEQTAAHPSASWPAPQLQSRTGPDIERFGPVLPFTGPSALPSAATLLPSGYVLVVYASGVGNEIDWFTGQWQGGDMTSWPYSLAYDQAYRPRVASFFPGSGLPPVVVEVHMATAGPGSLVCRTASGGPPFNAAAVYDQGPSANPSVTIAAIPGSQSAAVIEVHQDPTNGLWYREGTVPNDALVPVVAWGTSLAYPNGEHGVHPAVASYDHTLVEIHESLSGALLYKLGTIDADAGVTWGASQPYAPSGANPALAIDPANGKGVAVHSSANGDGTIFDRAFTIQE
jgi:hypothetical protein